ncbi:DUF2809 domain-containing protein [[Clostridium] innocuum]|nr:DUF2809 domain-containing protein [[Clostridium] innocuum]MCR0578376.1 DUF2809 domain-containing protein [[Clostridium] innocuum]
MRKQNRRNRWLLAGFVGVVIAAGLLSRSTYSLPNWFREYGGDTLWSMMMYGIFALLFPHARAKTLFIATLLFSYLIECSQLLDYDWLNTLRATPLRYLLGQGFVWSDLVCYSIGCVFACTLDAITLKRRHDIYE